jgi:hypothetical protein
MIQLFLWKFKRVFIENEREKREGKKNIHCCPTKNPLLARATSLERGRHVAHKATAEAGLWLLHYPSRVI